MKFLKTKNISKFSISDNAYIQNTFGRITIDSTNSLLLPRGTTSQRPDYDPSNPDSAAGTLSTNLNGSIRYNTTNNTIEGYIGGLWTTIRAPSATAIQKQRIGPGDFAETLFGPLRPDYALSYTASLNNIIVLVENVMQIGDENFRLVQNPSGTPVAAFYTSAPGYAGSYPTGYYLEFDEPVPIDKHVTVFFGYAN